MNEPSFERERESCSCLEMWKFFGRRKKRAPADESVADLREKFRLEAVSPEL